MRAQNIWHSSRWCCTAGSMLGEGLARWCKARFLGSSHEPVGAGGQQMFGISCTRQAAWRAPPLIGQHSSLAAPTCADLHCPGPHRPRCRLVPAQRSPDTSRRINSASHSLLGRRSSSQRAAACATRPDAQERRWCPAGLPFASGHRASSACGCTWAARSSGRRGSSHSAAG